MLAVLVGAVYEGVNELSMSANSPPQPRRGGRDIKKKPRSFLVGADGVVLVRLCKKSSVKGWDRREVIDGFQWGCCSPKQ